MSLLALAPPIAAGLALFGQPALEMLGIALTIGVLSHVLARLTRWPLKASPLASALIAVALIGPASWLGWVAVCAAGAAVGELLRGRLFPAARVQAGLFVYVVVLLATHGAPAAYLNPLSRVPKPEPIRLWLNFYGAAAAPIDTVKLYVGNVPGPVFATSLLAVIVALAWFWYARRLSPAVLVGYGVGALVPIAVLRWNPVFQLDSGPAWMVAGLVLADRRLLPSHRLARPIMGLAAGLCGFAMRQRGFGIEAAAVSVVGIQLVVVVVEGLGWAIRERTRMRAHVRGWAQTQGRIRLSNPFQRPRPASEGQPK